MKNKVCLFAGYDVDGIIDSYVISYVKELAKFCDVYYLADSNISEKELSRLSPYVKNAWSCRHGEYDFGSYARLIINFVGWENISQYDDVLFVNDSCYLIRPLDELFSEMDRRDADWWGLQATKGVAKTRYKSSNRYKEKILLSEIKNNYLEQYDNEYFYDFLVGSYFLSFSNRVVKSDVFRSFVESIGKEKNKLNIIRKYEIGLTRLLINSGFSFDTYMKYLYPFHPIFTNYHFDMIEEGFPLFKRFFLTQNHYHVPNLYLWEDKLVRSCPELKLDEIKENLARISNQATLDNNLHIAKIQKLSIYRHFFKSLIKRFKYHPVINFLFRKLKLNKKINEAKQIYKRHDPIFKIADKITSKDESLWVFPVCAYDGTLSGNDLAIFETVKNNNEIKKVILYRNHKIDIDGVNIEQFHISSKLAKKSLLRAGVVLIKHGVFANTLRPLNGKLRKIICLWHGIPLKRIGCASRDFQHRLKDIYYIHKDFYSVICSSEIDRMAMASAYVPLTFEQVWLTGLPRTDFMVKPKKELPNCIVSEIDKLKLQLKGRKLIFFCPTFKNGQSSSYYHFNESEVNKLNLWLKKNNAVLGIREHMASRGACYANYLYDVEPLDLSSRYYKNIEAIYHVADLLITDYSSAYIDFMVTKKPIISFAYDRNSYLNEERGLFYQFESAMPGPICESFNELMSELDKFSVHSQLIDEDKYQSILSMFYKYLDGNNSTRVINKIME
ncbi:MAG: CDP-glycerol glycerophosphotransferase family protein [Vibrio sp.]|uniref:CDP-glycerol glycerophosphotransferase family protein n=1 Tax=Vibrio sp. TaxID=678 RepID=UPI003A8C3646